MKIKLFFKLLGINYKDIIKRRNEHSLLEKIDKKLENIYITDNYKIIIFLIFKIKTSWIF